MPAALLIIGCVTEPEDCARVVGGNSYEDDCYVCDSDVSNDNITCVQDCNDDWDGTATF